MDVGTDVANSLINASSKITQDVTIATLTDTGKNVTNFGYAMLNILLKKVKNVKGNTNLEKILNSGQEIKMTELSSSDLLFFKKEAKKYKLNIAVIKDKNIDFKTVLYTAESVQMVEKILTDLINVKVNGIEAKQETKASIREKMLKLNNNENINHNGKKIFSKDITFKSNCKSEKAIINHNEK